MTLALSFQFAPQPGDRVTAHTSAQIPAVAAVAQHSPASAPSQPSASTTDCAASSTEFADFTGFSGLATAPAAFVASANSSPPTAQTVSSAVEFRVASPVPRPLSGARVLVIGNDGRLLANGLTDSAGKWRTTLTVPVDPRFAGVKMMGTVTAIAVARGFNEQIIFDVPVAPGEVQPITLLEAKSGQRNEPFATLGHLHRLIYAQVIDRYARLAHLGKQPPIAGEFQYAPWGPNSTSKWHKTASAPRALSSNSGTSAQVAPLNWERVAFPLPSAQSGTTSTQGVAP